MQADIQNFLKDDTIFNKMNKLFISPDSDDVKCNNQKLKEILEKKLIEAMRRQSPLFDKTYQRIVWAGSYFKKTRVGEPEEYDINLIINLPMKEKDLEFSSDCPSYVKIRTTWEGNNEPLYISNIGTKAYKEMKSFIDKDLYLNQEKFRGWMEGIMAKVKPTINIPIRKSGPAFTLSLPISNSGKMIDIDLVPVLAFPISNPPPRCPKLPFLQKSRIDRYWSAVPKPLNKKKSFGNDQHRYWRLCFYEFEKDILSSYEYGRAKPIIRHLKKLRDTENWKNIASYYIETLCLHELHIFQQCNKASFTSLFFTMLQKLRDAVRNHCIRYYWDEQSNLLENIEPIAMRNIEGRLNKIIKEIEKTIKDDRLAIARAVLNAEEFFALRNHLESETAASQALEPKSEEAEEFKSCCIT